MFALMFFTRITSVHNEAAPHPGKPAGDHEWSPASLAVYDCARRTISDNWAISSV
jgi:hypothetical protein